MVFPAMIGAQIAGNAVSSIFGASQARKERRANRQAEEDARRHNIEMWNMQNEYNHPSAQMARLQEAGLNPNMIYGASTGQATGQASDIAKGSPAEQPYYQKFEMDALRGITAHQNIKQSKAVVDNLRTQNSVLTQEEALKSAQSAEILTRTARTDFDLGLAKELRDTSVQAAQADVHLLREQIFGRQIDNLVNDAVAADRIKTIGLEMQNAVETLEGTKLSNALKEYERDLNDAGVQKNDALWERILMQVFSRYFNDPDERRKLENRFQPAKKWQGGYQTRTDKVNDSINQISVERRRDIVEDLYNSMINRYRN